jgi:hypothetical protein
VPSNTTVGSHVGSTVVVCSTARAADSTTAHGAYCAHGDAVTLSVGSCSWPVGAAMRALLGLEALTNLQGVPVVTTEDPSSGTNLHRPVRVVVSAGSTGTHCTTPVAAQGLRRRGADAHE